MTHKLTIPDALRLQRLDLDHWKRLLSRPAYTKLLRHVEYRTNLTLSRHLTAEITTAAALRAIVRGTDLNDLVFNLPDLADFPLPIPTTTTSNQS